MAVKRKLLLVDYYGICDEKHRPIGHSQKVLQEYAELIKDSFNITVAVSPCLMNGLDNKFDKIILLKYDIIEDGKKTLWDRIKDKFKLFYNIKEVMREKEYDVIWFYRTDFFLFFYFFLRIKYKRNKMPIFGLLYQEDFGGGRLSPLLTYFFRKGALKFDGLMYTQKGMVQFHPNILWLPDYYYDENKYKKYQGTKKCKTAVCLGTMNPYKKLEELVDVFNENGLDLEIKGYFYEKDRFQKLKKKKKENILIEDVILSEDEYYRALAEAKYSILPYDIEQYGCRTSGVLLESLFLNTIPVAPKELLRENDIEGIGYESLTELSDSAWVEKNKQKTEINLNIHFDKSNIKHRLISFINQENL